jgi:hypothetical protein
MLRCVGFGEERDFPHHNRDGEKLPAPRKALRVDPAQALRCD